MKRPWFLVLAVSVGLNAGLLTMALSRRGEGPGHDGLRGGPLPPRHFESRLERHLDRMTRSLGLDDEQRTAIAAVHRGLLPEIGTRHREMEELRRALAARYERPELDAAEFRALAGRLTKAQARLDSLVTEAMLGEAAVLTPEQRRKYAREMPWGRRGSPPDRPRDGR